MTASAVCPYCGRVFDYDAADPRIILRNFDGATVPFWRRAEAHVDDRVGDDCESSLAVKDRRDRAHTHVQP